MTQQSTDRSRTLMYLRLPFKAIPLFFRKYDARQATRMSVNVLKDCAREIVRPRMLRWLATVLKAAWYFASPLSIVFAARLAVTAPSVTHGLLWQVFSLAVIGLTLSAHALGKLMLKTNARALLFGILWLPMPLGLSFEANMVFVGRLGAAFGLARSFGVGPKAEDADHFGESGRRFSYLAGSDRRPRNVRTLRRWLKSLPARGPSFLKIGGRLLLHDRSTTGLLSPQRSRRIVAAVASR